MNKIIVILSSILAIVIILTFGYIFTLYKNNTAGLDRPENANLVVYNNDERISFFILGDAGTGQ